MEFLEQKASNNILILFLYIFIFYTNTAPAVKNKSANIIVNFRPKLSENGPIKIDPTAAPITANETIFSF